MKPFEEEILHRQNQIKENNFDSGSSFGAGSIYTETSDDEPELPTPKKEEFTKEQIMENV